jgi:uroporphyrinogen-III synthase
VWCVVGTKRVAQKIAKRCEKLGIQAEPFPLVYQVVNENIKDELQRITELDTSVFTSVSAVKLVFKNASLRLKKEISRSTCLTIGPATSESATKVFHCKNLFVAQPYSSLGLIKLIGEKKLGRCALFSSLKRSTELVNHLKKRCDVLYEPKLYDLSVDEKVLRKLENKLIQKNYFGYVFTCSTAVYALANLLGKTNANFVAMGPRTASALSQLGVKCYTPDSYDVDGVVSLISVLSTGN